MASTIQKRRASPAAAIGALSSIALLAVSQPAFASDADVCNSLEAMLVRLDEKLEEWQLEGRSDRMGLIRLNSKVVLASAHAGDNGWAGTFVDTLASMSIVALDDAEPPLANEEIPAFLFAQANSLLPILSDKCPETEFVDISRFADQTGG